MSERIVGFVAAIYTKSPGVDVSVMLQTLVRDGMFWMLGCVLAVVLGGFFLLLRVR